MSTTEQELHQQTLKLQQLHLSNSFNNTTAASTTSAATAAAITTSTTATASSTNPTNVGFLWRT